MFKLDLEKAEDPEIKLPTSVGLLKNQEFQKNIDLCFIDYIKAFDCVDHNKLENSERDENTTRSDLPPGKSVCRSRDWTWNNRLVIVLSQIGKGAHQGCILSPCLFNLYAENIMRNDGLDEAQAGIKIAGRNIHNLRYANDMTLMAENKEELKSLLMKAKEESEKVALKLKISEN